MSDKNKCSLDVSRPTTTTKKTCDNNNDIRPLPYMPRNTLKEIFDRYRKPRVETKKKRCRPQSAAVVPAATAAVTIKNPQNLIIPKRPQSSVVTRAQKRHYHHRPQTAKGCVKKELTKAEVSVQKTAILKLQRQYDEIKHSVSTKQAQFTKLLAELEFSKRSLRESLTNDDDNNTSANDEVEVIQVLAVLAQNILGAEKYARTLKHMKSRLVSECQITVANINTWQSRHLGCKREVNTLQTTRRKVENEITVAHKTAQKLQQSLLCQKEQFAKELWALEQEASEKNRILLLRKAADDDRRDMLRQYKNPHKNLYKQRFSRQLEMTTLKSTLRSLEHQLQVVQDQHDSLISATGENDLEKMIYNVVHHHTTEAHMENLRQEAILRLERLDAEWESIRKKQKNLRLNTDASFNNTSQQRRKRDALRASASDGRRLADDAESAFHLTKKRLDDVATGLSNILSRLKLVKGGSNNRSDSIDSTSLPKVVTETRNQCEMIAASKTAEVAGLIEIPQDHQKVLLRQQASLDENSEEDDNEITVEEDEDTLLQRLEKFKNEVRTTIPHHYEEEKEEAKSPRKKACTTASTLMAQTSMNEQILDFDKRKELFEHIQQLRESPITRSDLKLRSRAAVDRFETFDRFLQVPTLLTPRGFSRRQKLISKEEDYETNAMDLTRKFYSEQRAQHQASKSIIRLHNSKNQHHHIEESHHSSSTNAANSRKFEPSKTTKRITVEGPKYVPETAGLYHRHSEKYISGIVIASPEKPKRPKVFRNRRRRH